MFIVLNPYQIIIIIIIIKNLEKTVRYSSYVYLLRTVSKQIVYGFYCPQYRADEVRVADPG